MEGAVRSKEPVCDDGVKVGMKPGVISESVDHHDHPQDALIEVQHRAKEHLQALVGAVAKLCQELSIVLEIDAHHDRDAENELSMGDGVKDVVKEPLLLLAMLVIAGLKIRIVVVQYLPQGRICWLSWVIDW